MSMMGDGASKDGSYAPSRCASPPPKDEAIFQSTTSNIEAGLESKVETDFTVARKYWIIFLSGLAALFSPLSSSIYYPAITELSLSFKVSIELINLTITSYMVMSGIGPALVSDLADHIGRRPVYISTLSLYFAVNIGLACQKSYPALLVLRMLQSLGASGSISLLYGTVSDLWPPSQRGRHVGLVTCGPNLAPTIGPILGAVFAEKAGWAWIFWFLAISSGLCLALFITTFPETVQSIRDPQASARIIALDFTSYQDQSSRQSKRPKKRKFHIPNPLASIFVLFHRTPALLATINAIYYTTAACIMASLSTQFIAVYKYSTLQAGLLYIPFGVSTIAASYFSGWVLELDYRVTSAHTSAPAESPTSAPTATEPRFPIEKARLRSTWVMILIASAAVAGYGWCITKKVHVSALVIMSILITVPQTIISNQLNTLMTDLHPSAPSTSQASMNIARCSLAAAGLAVLQIMIERVGAGWSFTVFAGLCAACWIPVYIILKSERRHVIIS